jgi:SAM-dependent methyltransferase
MTMEKTLLALRAVAESTRIRLLALIAGGEISVGELTAVLDQSQPRVSRHLKLLVDAGLVTRFRDRHHIYYCLTASKSGRDLIEQVLTSMEGDALLTADQQRMYEVKQSRERTAYSRLGHSPALWPDTSRSRPADEDIRYALDDALGNELLGDLLDIGSGTGALLQCLASRAITATGIDQSQEMRLLARARLQQAGFADCTVRYADMHALPFADNSFDTVLLDEVLSGATDAALALAEANRVVRNDGHLVVLDWLLPVSLQNRVGDAGGMAENQLRTLLAEHGLHIERRSWLPGRTPNYALVVARSAAAIRTGTNG